ncbi:MAG: hypothetical protein JWP02_922 [Acidimicrobiales bacterium]|nr:hypothetical protein [Acidimicrobiales bacterium]
MTDPISAASARLFGAGIDRRQRLVALRFLGLLVAQADRHGRVLCDPDDLVGLGILNGLSPEEVNRSRLSLEAVGVLDREPSGWFIQDFSPVGDEVPPAEAMDAIARVLARPAEADERVPAVPLVPVPAEPAVALTPFDAEPPPRHSFTRWMAAPVGIAAAALVIALALGARLPLPVPGRTVTHTSENVERASTATDGGASSTSPSASSPASRSTGPGTSAPSLQPSGTSTLGGTGPTATVVCPSGTVVATVEHVDQQVDSSVPTSARISAGIPPIVHTTVSGVVRNMSPAAAVVPPFPVDVTFSDGSGSVATVTASALSSGATVAPGASLPWEIRVDNPPKTPIATGAKADGPTWRWEDPALAVACPR